MLILSFSIGLLCCKTERQDKNYDTLNPKFRLLDSLLFLDKQQDIAKILDTIKTTIKSDDVENLTYYYYYRGMVSNSNFKLSNYADSALNLFGEERIQQKYADAYIKSLLIKGLVYKNIKRYNEALDCYLKIKSLADEIADAEKRVYINAEYAEYMQNIADIYFRQRHYEEAAKYYLHSYHIYTQVRGPDLRNVFYNK